MIVFENVSLRYENRYLFKDFSLKIDCGEKVLLLGDSGSGKTTFFRLLLGFARPEGGNIFFNGAMLSRATVWEVRRRVAYVSQDLDIGEGSVRDLFDRVFGYKATSDRRLDDGELFELLAFLRLPESILNEDFSGLSGGEKQRVAVVMAIMLKRDVFLLDEATAAMDPALKQRVADYFLERNGWTVLATSHDREWLEKPVRILTLGRS